MGDVEQYVKIIKFFFAYTYYVYKIDMQQRGNYVQMRISVFGDWWIRVGIREIDPKSRNCLAGGTGQILSESTQKALAERIDL